MSTGNPFSKEKFRFTEYRLSWIGYDIRYGGITIEEEKLKALSQFLRPTNVSELRFFLSFVQQLAGFSTESAALKGLLRILLSTLYSFVLTTEPDQGFEALKLAHMSRRCWSILTQFTMQPFSYLAVTAL
jgi:hypothetical protein